MKLSLTELFKCRVDAAAADLVAIFPDMVKFWIDSAGSGVFSFQSLRNRFYDEWKTQFEGFDTRYAQTSCLVAVAVGCLNKPVNRRVSVGDFKLQFAVVPSGLRLSNGKIIFPIARGVAGAAALSPLNEQQRLLIEQAEAEQWRLGQTFLTRNWAALTFTRFISLGGEDECVLKLLG
ncbi:MAG: hypothetical protein NWF09_08915 [Candidatus Bathyarchaeota archaeon]|nr:hypothetical protein [Candidatus Bathyarchaeota archaeon]